jgi:hypothetical protein
VEGLGVGGAADYLGTCESFEICLSVLRGDGYP